ncbi:CvpA family protein [Paenibacillus sp. y28]|uniref:CvpA family protein n=1 Tax=Paenibacillus sp. y28 TaxID=3129110 RepID=UPI00301923B9
MNIVDLIALLLLAGGLVYGYYRGLVNQLFSLAGGLLAGLLAFILQNGLAEALMKMFPLAALTGGEHAGNGLSGSVWSAARLPYHIAAYVFIFAGAKLTLHLLGRLLHVLMKAPGLNLFNRFGGIVLALAQVFILMVLLYWPLNRIPSAAVQQELAGSQVATGVNHIAPRLTAQLEQLWQAVTGAKNDITAPEVKETEL